MNLVPKGLINNGVMHTGEVFTLVNGTGGKLVADALADDFAFKLGKGEQDVQRQPPHERGGVKLLCHRNKRDVVAIKDFDQFGKIHQGRPSLPVVGW